MKIVKFGDGQYGIRKWSWGFIIGMPFKWLGIDQILSGRKFWFIAHSNYESCRAPLDTVRVALVAYKNYIQPYDPDSDWGKPV